MSKIEGLSAEEQVLYERLGPLFDEERMRMAKSLTAKADHELLGQNEFEMRDRLHAFGAQVLTTAANERQKKGRVRGC